MTNDQAFEAAVDAHEAACAACRAARSARADDATRDALRAARREAFARVQRTFDALIATN